MTTKSNDDRYLYLTIMRDLREYCAKGYCDVEICLFHFLELPASLVKRMLSDSPTSKQVGHMIIDWCNSNSVHTFMYKFIKIVTELNHVPMNIVAYDLAFDEFTQYINKKK